MANETSVAVQILCNEQRAYLANLPRKIARHSGNDAARGEISPCGKFMPFYHDNGELLYVMDMRTCRMINLPTPIAFGPPAPVWAQAERIAQIEKRLHLQVYFIGHLDHAIKIGTSYSAKERMKTLQAGSPIKLEILATRPGSTAVEVYYHDAFAAHRLHGEWFTPHADILAEIERLNRITTTSAQIEATAAANGWRAQVGECVG